MMRENKIFFANKMEERHFDLLEEDIFTSTHTFTTSHFSLHYSKYSFLLPQFQFPEHYSYEYGDANSD